MARILSFNTTELKSRFDSVCNKRKLSKAIKKSEFKLKYQPIISLNPPKLIGLEALIRWQNPKKGEILPANFMPLLEKTDLIKPVGRWVLSKACSELSKWNKVLGEYGPVKMNINLSPVQFSDDKFLYEIEKTLKSNDINPELINFEITETVLLENGYSEKFLQKLDQIGVKISLDDFGTGYSPLSSLYEYQIDELKISREFTNAMDISRDKLEIVKAIINLGHSLGKVVVGEGVETEGQAQQLEKFGCDNLQGFLFFTPMETSEVDSLVEKIIKNKGTLEI